MLLAVVSDSKTPRTKVPLVCKCQFPSNNSFPTISLMSGNTILTTLGHQKYTGCSHKIVHNFNHVSSKMSRWKKEAVRDYHENFA